MDEEVKLDQHMIYWQAEQKGPKIIKLDDPKNKNSESMFYYLTVHLVKIDMPELKPRATGRGPTDEGATKEWDKKGKGKEKEKGKGKLTKQDKREPPSPGHQGLPTNTQQPGFGSTFFALLRSISGG